MRGHLAEFGLIAPKGTVHLQRLLALLIAPEADLPNEVIEIAQMLLDQIDGQWARSPRDEASARLMTIPGVGPIYSAAVAAFSAPMESFRKGRDFAAWLGLTPRQHSTGGKAILGRMSKMGQRDIRRRLITGAMAVVRWAVIRGANNLWLAELLKRKPRMVVAVALANKMARTIWALLTKGGLTGFRSLPHDAVMCSERWRM